MFCRIPRLLVWLFLAPVHQQWWRKTHSLAHLHLNPYCCPLGLLVRINCKHLNENGESLFLKGNAFCGVSQSWQEQKIISKLQFSDNLNRMIFTLVSQAYLPPFFLPRSFSSYLHTEKIESLKCVKIHSNVAHHLVSLPTPVSTFPKAKLGVVFQVIDQGTVGNCAVGLPRTWLNEGLSYYLMYHGLPEHVKASN